MRRPTVLVAAILAGSVAGCARLPSPGISESPFSAYGASLAVLGDGLVVGWSDTRDGHPAIYARILDDAGVPSGPPRRLTTLPPAYEPDLAVSNGTIVAGWYEQKTDGGTSPHIGAWTRDGMRLWASQLGASGRSVVVRAHGDVILAAWLVDDDATSSSVWAAWFTAGGAPRADAVRVASASRTTGTLSAALDGASAWLAFDVRAGTRAEEVVLVQFDAASLPRVAPLTSDDGFPSRYPDVSVDGGRLAVAWIDSRDGNQEIYLAQGSISAPPATLGGAARRVTETSGDSISPSLQWNGERLGLSWCDDASGEQEIYFQAFDVGGAPAAPARRVTRTPWASLHPAIRAAGGGFLLAWNEWDRDAIRAGHDDMRRAQIHSAFVPGPSAPPGVPD